MELLLIIFLLGYLMQHVASITLIFKIWTQKSIEGFAVGTQIIFFVGAILRCIWVHETRLTDEFLTYVELFFSVICSTILLYLFWRFRGSRALNIRDPFDFRLILVACMILSYFFHPGKKLAKYYFSMQMLVSMSMFSEACGLLPQLYYIRKVGYCEVITGRYILFLGFSRFLRMIFWIMMWQTGGNKFIYLILADLVHSVILADFVVQYLRNKNGRMILIR